jgi:hypothetical protein
LVLLLAYPAMRVLYSLVEFVDTHRTAVGATLGTTLALTVGGFVGWRIFDQKQKAAEAAAQAAAAEAERQRALEEAEAKQQRALEDYRHAEEVAADAQRQRGMSLSRGSGRRPPRPSSRSGYGSEQPEAWFGRCTESPPTSRKASTGHRQSTCSSISRRAATASG